MLTAIASYLRPEKIGPADCPLMHRWTLIKLPVIKLMVHHFLPGVDDPHTHDHPSPFVTFVLRGTYEDIVLCPYRCEEETSYGKLADAYRQRGEVCPGCGGSGQVVGERMTPGRVRYRRAAHAHRTRVGPNGCWTIVVMGPKVRSWGFWLHGYWLPWRHYDELFGTGWRCDPLEAHLGANGAGEDWRATP